MGKCGTDTRDIRSGTCDPINKDGLPQSDQVRDRTTPHEKAQWGADVGRSAAGNGTCLAGGTGEATRGAAQPSNRPEQDEVVRIWQASAGKTRALMSLFVLRLRTGLSRRRHEIEKARYSRDLVAVARDEVGTLDDGSTLPWTQRARKSDDVCMAVGISGE